MTGDGGGQKVASLAQVGDKRPSGGEEPRIRGHTKRVNAPTAGGEAMVSLVWQAGPTEWEERIDFVPAS